MDGIILRHRSPSLLYRGDDIGKRQGPAEIRLEIKTAETDRLVKRDGNDELWKGGRMGWKPSKTDKWKDRFN